VPREDDSHRAAWPGSRDLGQYFRCAARALWPSLSKNYDRAFLKQHRPEEGHRIEMTDKRRLYRVGPNRGLILRLIGIVSQSVGLSLEALGNFRYTSSFREKHSSKYVGQGE
jgi:hypothetical protein